jgi:hypothetical protein
MSSPAWSPAFRLSENSSTSILHIHAIATDGVFTPEGAFLCLPRSDKQLLLDVWQDNVFKLFVREGKIDRETADQMQCWPHSGFSVDKFAIGS